MYAIKIRKIDLALLTLLNGGVTPEIEKKTTYLIVNPESENFIVDEKRFVAEFAGRISVPGPHLLKINKR